MVNLSSWGRIEKWPHQVEQLSDRLQVFNQLKSKPGIAYGMGRSYGDQCLNPHGTVWRTIGLNRFISFNDQTGELVCEAGVLLQDIQRLLASRGWLLPVTPGTQLITVGGAIANDIHGKNHHHRGSFGQHVQWIKLLRTDGKMMICSRQTLSDWFSATIGGLGLTGLITEVALQLMPIQSQWLKAETIIYENLEDFFALSQDSENWEYTVSWIDCLSKRGRGIFLRANFIEANDVFSYKKKKTFPFTPPFSLINKQTLPIFNALYFNLKKINAGIKTIHYESFLYPLDALLEWNRLYGPKGFYQYQVVVPWTQGPEVIKALLTEIVQEREGSFLNVLKTFGKNPSLGMLSFPMHGITLAVDFPNRGTKTLNLFARLDKIIAEAKGRIYLAKDACMPRDLFESGYPKYAEFKSYRDPGISSALSRRLMGD